MRVCPGPEVRDGPDRLPAARPGEVLGGRGAGQAGAVTRCVVGQMSS